MRARVLCKFQGLGCLSLFRGLVSGRELFEGCSCMGHVLGHVPQEWLFMLAFAGKTLV